MAAETTLCYIEHDGAYLMLLRNKKKNDLNEGKWIGVGGKLEPGETAEECLIREVREETGLSLKRYKKFGVIDFVSDEWGHEVMHLFEGYADDEEAAAIDFDCPEGELRWIPKADIMKLNLWEGDRIFLNGMINGNDNLYLKLIYSGDILKAVENTR